MSYADYRLLRVSSVDGICRATIDNPPINLLDVPLAEEIVRLTQQVAADDDVRVLVVDSADPDFFVAHADVGMILDLPTDDTGLHDELSFFHTVMEDFRTMPKATIAVIEGICRGGGSEWAMAFDMRYAALGQAVFGQPEVALGIIPGGGGTQRLPRLVGRGVLWRSSWAAGTSMRRPPKPGDMSIARCHRRSCGGSWTSSPPASPRRRWAPSRRPNARSTPRCPPISPPDCAPKIGCSARLWPSPLPGNGCRP